MENTQLFSMFKIAFFAYEKNLKKLIIKFTFELDQKISFLHLLLKSHTLFLSIFSISIFFCKCCPNANFKNLNKKRLEKLLSVALRQKS